MNATTGLARCSFTAFGGAACEVLAQDARPEAVQEAVGAVYAFERRFTRFDAASELSAFNRRAGTWVGVTPMLEALLRAALDAYLLSDGRVNAACLQALVASGYDRSIEAVRARTEAPPQSGEARPLPPLPDVLVVGAGRAHLAAGAAVDLGGIGKGWLADRLSEDFDNCVINLGGDLRVRGTGPDGAGWSVGLCDGQVVMVSDAGVATSGTAGRRWCSGHHLIDPRTGRPADTDALAVSVVAADALRAEVLAKGACLVGSSGAAGWLRAHSAVRHAAVWGMPAAA